MRKLISLIAATLFASTTSLQVVACGDNSKYQEFLSHVNNGDTFFGIMGLPQLRVYQDVVDGLSTMQLPASGSQGKSYWDNFLADNETLMGQRQIKKIDIITYDGPIYFEYKDSPPDVSKAVDKFWSDSSITWQKNIFDWIIKNKSNSDFALPSKETGAVEIKPLKDKDKSKDGSFTALPIIFIVNKGKLMTAGQGWSSIDEATKPGKFYNDFTQLILANLLTEKPTT